MLDQWVTEKIPTDNRPPPDIPKENPGAVVAATGAKGEASRFAQKNNSPNFPENARERLNNRRGHELFNFEHCGFDYTTGFGCFPDGKPAEIFLNTAKTGTMLEALAKDASVIASIALQYGAPVETLRHALMRDSQGNASSPLGRALDILSGRHGGRP